MKPLRRKRRTSARLGVRRGGERGGEGDDDLENDDLENDEDESEDEVYFNSSGAQNTRNKKNPVQQTRRKLEDAFDRIAEKRGGKGKLLHDAFDDFEEEYFETEEKNVVNND